MKIGERIKDLRKAHGLTQEELAQALNMNRVILNRIELGSRPLKDDEVKIFSDFFGVSADFLLNTKYKLRSGINIPVDDVITARLVGLISRSTPQNLQIASNLLEQLNDNGSIA